MWTLVCMKNMEGSICASGILGQRPRSRDPNRPRLATCLHESNSRKASSGKAVKAFISVWDTRRRRTSVCSTIIQEPTIVQGFYRGRTKGKGEEVYVVSNLGQPVLQLIIVSGLVL